ELRPPRQGTPTVLVEVGQDGVEPAPHVAAEEQSFRAQRAHQRILHQVVGDIGVARERAGIAAQGRNHGFETLAKRAHGDSVFGSVFTRALRKDREGAIALSAVTPKFPDYSSS